MKPHKHAELIKAWADGAEIERYDHEDKDWLDDEQPLWYEADEYRIKPEPKPDVVEELSMQRNHNEVCMWCHGKPNLKLTFDGETGELKSAEVLK